MDSSASTAESQPRLRVLDAFRALAILAVLVHHYLPRWAPPDHWRNLYGYARTWPQWLDLGALGVQFFFIISGFVIFMTLERCQHLFEFWFRRVARIYPAYVVATITTFMLVNAFGPDEFHSTPWDAIVGLTFLTPYVPGAKFVEPAYWSLVVEMKFYLVIGLVYAASRGRFITAWTLFVGAGLVAYVVGGVQELHPVRSIANHVFLIEYLPNFTAGIAFYQLWKRERGGWQILALLALTNYFIVASDRDWQFHMVHAAMIVAFALFALRKLEWLAIRPLVFIGGISYSLYLVHQYIGVSLIAWLKRGLHLPDLAAAAIATLACGILAWGLTRLVEEPAKKTLLAWGRTRLGVASLRFPSFSFARSFQASRVESIAPV
jgi:peptidoglycan/LPS O-acetylase OafA/YrhL